MFSKNYVAAGAIPAYSLVKFNGVAGQVAVAAAATDEVVGVTGDVDVVAGERVDVIHLCEAQAVAGAAIAAGKFLVSDAAGRAVAAAPGAGANVRTVGYAREAAAALGDVIQIMVQPGSMQG